jgi:putative transposase
MLFHDRDSKFTAAVGADLTRADIEIIETALRAPNTNAYVERFVQTIQQECLDHFVILGQRHFDYLVTEWLEYYHRERPHQAKDNELSTKPTGSKPSRDSTAAQNVTVSGVRCKLRLGGLLRATVRRREEGGQIKMCTSRATDAGH